MKLTPTKEQQAIVTAAVEGKNLVARAYAGAAKSTTLKLVAEAIPKPAIYLAFNKTIAEEAKLSFPSTVDCRTIHSLAYRAIVTKEYRKKLQGFFNWKDIEELPSWGALHEESDLIEAKALIVDCIEAYCASSKTKLTTLPEYLNIVKLEEVGPPIAKLVTEYWKAIVDTKSTVKITHNVYLKLFQLSQPILPCELLLVDESQDLQDVVIKLIQDQLLYGIQIIVTGDEFQSIYEWNRAKDALDKFPGSFQELYLTESFRFTQAIADKATSLLSYLGNDRPIIGRAVEADIQTKCTIVRNNTTLIDELLQAYQRGEKVKVLADLKPVWAKLYHISALRFKEIPKYPDKELAQYSSYNELLKAAKLLPELSKLLNITNVLISYGSMHSSIANIKSIIVTKEEDADFTLTTAHKSKGLQWEEVTLREDLLIVPEDYTGEIKDLLFKDQTANLIYVALSRAQYKVNLPSTIKQLLERNL